MDETQERILGLVNQGKLGFSTGSSSHLVERERVGTATAIRSWPISELSVTPTPAESRNTVMALKSLTAVPLSALTSRDCEQEAREIVAKMELLALPQEVRQIMYQLEVREIMSGMR